MPALNSSSPDYQHAVAAVAARLQEHQGPIVVLAHENPDGDALGSVLGLSRALRASGKTVIAPMEVPRYLQFVVEPGEMSLPLGEWPVDALVAVLDVDNNDPVRVAGADLATFNGPVVNIDHHGTNLRRADAVVVDPARPAATMIVADVIDALGIPWSEAIATPLMLGLNTDTGNFAFESVTPETFECAARLRSYGARIGWLTEQLRQKPHSYYLLLREVLGTLEFLAGDVVVLARVDAAMLERAGASWEEVESYVGLLRNAEGSKLAVMIKDFGDRVKVSLRSSGGISAQNIAVELGGGGHVPAAGATLAEPYAEARRKIDDAIGHELERASRASAAKESAPAARS